MAATRQEATVAWACARRALSTSMVEQSIINVFLPTDGMISFQTLRTCLPAGSMVTTTSAPFTASAAVAAIATPSALAVSLDA